MNVNWKEMDTTNGKTGWYGFRQLIAVLSQLIFLTLAWLGIKGIIFLLLAIAFDSEKASKSIEWFQPLILALWGPFAIWHGLNNTWQNPKGNNIQATINRLVPKFGPDQGSKFIAYPPGLSFKMIGEDRGFTTVIEREDTAKTELFKVTATGVALQIIISMVWIPDIRNLSKWLQNLGDETQHNKVIKQITAKIQEVTEEVCGNLRKPRKLDWIKNHQSEIIALILPKVREEAERYGVRVVNLAFSKCDDPEPTEAARAKALEAKVVTEIAKGLIKANVDPTRAHEIAAVLAGIPNARLDTTVFDLRADKQIADAMAAVTSKPEIILLLQELKQQLGKGKKTK